MDEKTLQLTAKMHKAITIIQFKEENRIYHRRPEWQMEDRCLLEHVNTEQKTCSIGDKEYKMKDCNFPTGTIEMTAEETELMQKLYHSFRVSEKLRKHILTILSHGCLYTICNSNLLYHASVPLNDDGSLKDVEILGQKYQGKELMSYIGQLVRSA